MADLQQLTKPLDFILDLLNNILVVNLLSGEIICQVTLVSNC